MSFISFISFNQETESGSPPGRLIIRARRLDDIIVDAGDFPHRRVTRFTVQAGTVLLIAPLRGSAEISGEDFTLSADTRNARLMVRRGQVAITWTEGSAGAIFRLPRIRLQALASAFSGDPLRFAGVNLALERFGAQGLDPWFRTVFAAMPGNESLSDSADFTKAFFDILHAQGKLESAFVVSRSVKGAMEHMRACGPAVDIEALSVKAGVTPRTLRENFKACLGMPLSAYVRWAQLNEIRQRLEGLCEARPMEELAKAADYGCAVAFVRAYRRVFGETPTQTRARAVRSSHERQPFSRQASTGSQ